MSMSTDAVTDGRLLAIDEIVGIFGHSSSCQATTQTTLVPRIPLHPDVRNFALDLFRRHIPLAQVQIECRDYAEKKWGNRAGDGVHRFRFTAKETTSLYRSLRSEMCIGQGTLAEDNLHKWFRPHKPEPPSAALSEALVYYQPHVPGKTERFELVLSTPEQRKLAWKYGHKKIVLMDGTFGVCSARILLFILMAIDEANHGIPIAFMLFTAKQGHKAVHASYDGSVLQGLLSRFKIAMGTNKEGETFTIAIGMTDNDPREHHALRSVWPEIFLMLCLFHMSQAWRNGLNTHLRVVPKGDARKQVRARIGKLLRRLLKEITDYNQAVTAYNDEVVHFRQMAESTIEIPKKQAQGALSFLTYLQDYLKDYTFWRTWSAASAVEAAARLNIPINTIPRTTNHLESFNGRLKHKYFQPYLKSGRLPRIDVYVLTLVKDVIPTILAERIERQTIENYRQSLTTTPGPRPAKRISTTVEASAERSAEPAVATGHSHKSTIPEPDLSILECDTDGDQEDEIDLEDEAVNVPELLLVRAEEDTASIAEGNDVQLPQPETGSPNDAHHDWEWDMVSEHALEDDDIICDLSIDTFVEMPHSLAQQPSESTSNILGELYEEHNAERAVQNAQMVAWRQLMLAQDESAKYLKELLGLGMSWPRLQEFMSDSIVARIRRTPAQVLNISAKRAADTEADTPAPKRVRFDRQIKEARKESHGMR